MAHRHARTTIAAIAIGLVSIGAGAGTGFAAEVDVPAHPQPVPAMVLSKLYAGKTTTWQRVSTYWAPDHSLIGIDAHGYFAGTWSAAAGNICYDAIWHQSPKPKQSTSSQGGGFIPAQRRHGCFDYANVGRQQVQRVVTDDDSGTWVDASLKSIVAQPGNTIVADYRRLQAQAPN